MATPAAAEGGSAARAATAALPMASLNEWPYLRRLPGRCFLGAGRRRRGTALGCRGQPWRCACVPPMRQAH
eukprot:11960182-Alexandrium_andersonii.AAC.1